MYRLVSFDIWNTLLRLDKFYELVTDKISLLTGNNIDSSVMQRIYREAIKARLRGEFNRPIYDSAVYFSQRLGIDVEVLFRATVLAAIDEGVSDIRFDDSEPVLSALKRRGYMIAFLGNVMFWPGMVTRIILEKNNLLRYADITLFGDEIGVQKPDKKIFEFLAERCGCKLGEILHVGDSLVNDFSGALMAGAGAVLLRRGLSIEKVAVSSNAFVIGSLRQLVEILG